MTYAEIKTLRRLNNLDIMSITLEELTLLTTLSLKAEAIGLFDLARGL